MRKLIKGLGLLLLALVALAACAIAGLYIYRPGMDQLAAHRYVEPAPSAHPLYATWFGVTGLLLDDGESAVMVDPFFTRPPGFVPLLLNRPIAPDPALIRRWLGRAGVHKLDAVLVSHSHYDHAMDAGVVARLTGATLAGSPSTANIGRGAGLAEAQICVVAPGQPFTAGAYTITFIAAQHAGATGGAPTGDINAPLVPPARYLDYRQGGTYSILIQHPSGSVLHHGSAGVVPGALRGLHADIVFLGIALLDNLPAYLREVVEATGARRVVPTHWDDFTRPLDEPLRPFPGAVRLDRFFDAIARERPDLEVQTLEAGRRVRLFP